MSASEFKALSAEAVRDQLSRILCSRTFSRAGYLCRFLDVCVEETLRGNSGQLKELWLGRAVFGRSGDFNPSANPIVRVQAKRLREKMGKFYETEGVLDPVRISFVPGSYVPVFSTSVPRQASLGCGYRWVAVAVRPMVPLDANLAGAQFAERVTVELTRALVETGKVEVASQDSAWGYPGQGRDAREVGRTLDVQHVVEGSVSLTETCHRICLQVTAAGTGCHWWSAWFEQRNVGAYPDTQQIARMLNDALTAVTKDSFAGAPNAVMPLQSTSANPRFM